MGCASSMNVTWQQEDMARLVAETNGPLGVQRQERIQYSNHGANVLELKGEGWLFNWQAPLDRMMLTARGFPIPIYEMTVQSINKVVVASMKGLPKCPTPQMLPALYARRGVACRNAVGVMNKMLAEDGINARWETQDGLTKTTLTGVRVSGGGMHNRPVQTTCQRSYSHACSLYLVFSSAAPQPSAPVATAVATADVVIVENEKDDVVSKLKSLAELKAKGVLSDAEFASMKSRVLATAKF